VAVRDSGPGVDPVDLERVFEAFYTTKSGGVGMGLSICRSIIDAHGGRLWVEANGARGAVFQFTIPGAEWKLANSVEAAQGSGDIASEPAHQPPREGDGQSRLSGRRSGGRARVRPSPRPAKSRNSVSMRRT
jgi:hypothetical protein